MNDEHTKESLIEEIKQVAEKLNRNTVSRPEFMRETGILNQGTRDLFLNQGTRDLFSPLILDF